MSNGETGKGKEQTFGGKQTFLTKKIPPPLFCAKFPYIYSVWWPASRKRSPHWARNAEDGNKRKSQKPGGKPEVLRSDAVQPR